MAAQCTPRIEEARVALEKETVAPDEAHRKFLLRELFARLQVSARPDDYRCIGSTVTFRDAAEVANFADCAIGDLSLGAIPVLELMLRGGQGSHGRHTVPPDERLVISSKECDGRLIHARDVMLAKLAGLGETEEGKEAIRKFAEDRVNQAQTLVEEQLIRDSAAEKLSLSGRTVERAIEHLRQMEPGGTRARVIESFTRALVELSGEAAAKDRIDWGFQRFAWNSRIARAARNLDEQGDAMSVETGIAIGFVALRYGCDPNEVVQDWFFWAFETAFFDCMYFFFGAGGTAAGASREQVIESLKRLKLDPSLASRYVKEVPGQLQPRQTTWMLLRSIYTEGLFFNNGRYIPEAVPHIQRILSVGPGLIRQDPPWWFHSSEFVIREGSGWPNELGRLSDPLRAFGRKFEEFRERQT